MIIFGRCSRASAASGVVVDALVLAADAVGHDLVLEAREGERVPVRQVAAVGEVHAEDRVAGLQRRQVDGHVRLGARVRLDVGVLGREERLRAVDRERLDLVHELAAAVVPLARIPLGVLVGQHRALRLAHRARDPVLRRDELDPLVLAPRLGLDPARDVRIDDLQISVEKGQDSSQGRVFHAVPVLIPTTSWRYSVLQ